MADNNSNTQGPATKKADLVSEIGTLTYPRAAKAFGKERAVEVMQQVAKLGGHGLFDEKELTSPLFGGLAMPSAETVLPPRKEDFAKSDDPEFRYDEALEIYEETKKTAVSNRAAINEFYLSLK